jgi:Tfp pilus assembly protein PilV
MFVKLLDNSEGFSLIETMAGIILLTIAIFPALGYFTNSVDFVHQTEIRSQAMDIAADTMEYFQAEAQNNWSDINTKSDSFSLDDLVTFEAQYDDNLLIDDYTIDIYLTENEVVEGNKKISVRVLWNNDSKSVQLNSLLRGGS